MSEDIGRLAEETRVEDVRRAYLALAKLWWARSKQLDGAPLAATLDRLKAIELDNTAI